MWEKVVFFDVVGYFLVDDLKEYVDVKYMDEDVVKVSEKYVYKMLFIKEFLFYCDIFEEFFLGKVEWIKDYWMLNSDWEGCDVDDLFVCVLFNYGDLGKQ